MKDDDCKRCGRPRGWTLSARDRCACVVPATGPLADRLAAARWLDAQYREREAERKKAAAAQRLRPESKPAPGYPWHPSEQRQCLLPTVESARDKPPGWPS